jgi:hypothetical protein
MTRRRWCAALFTTLLGTWGAARARGLPPVSPPDPAAASDTSVTYYRYDAARRLFAVRDEPGMVTTYVYDCSGRPSNGC